MMSVRQLAPALLLAASATLAATPAAAGSLDSFIAEIDVHARADMGSFRADLSATFGVSRTKVDGLFEVLPGAADVYMCLRVGELSRQPIDRVVAEFRRHKGQGWGVIAKSLGIEPGSAEFHALKAGRLSKHGSGRHAHPKGSKSKGKRS